MPDTFCRLCRYQLIYSFKQLFKGGALLSSFTDEETVTNGLSNFLVLSQIVSTQVGNLSQALFAAILYSFYD